LAPVSPAVCWATLRKHLPLADVAPAGGWKSMQTLLKCFQQPDEATMLESFWVGSSSGKEPEHESRPFLHRIFPHQAFRGCVGNSKLL
jgi:hypothetical protein